MTTVKIDPANKAKPKRCGADEPTNYFFVDCGYVFEETDYHINLDNQRWKIGNYFQTREQAQKAADAMPAFFERFHE